MNRNLTAAATGLLMIFAARAQQTGNGDHSVPRFHAVPTVAAFAPENSSRVVTIATADADAANGPDLITVHADGTLNVTYNDGGGGFGNSHHNTSAVALKPNVVYIETADLNADGFPDVVAMDPANSAFLVFLNNADGTFGDAVSIPAGNATAKLQGGGLTIGDVNGDRKPDIVTLSRTGTDASTTFSQQTFLGVGDGTFQPAPAVDSTLTGPVSMFPGKGVSLADVNRDGKPDLVLQLDRGGVVIAVSPGAGDGSFQPFTASDPIIGSGPQPASSLTLGDVNGDELPDALFINFNDKVYLAPGREDGSFGPPVAVASNLSGAVLLRLADLNNDGRNDIVLFAAGVVGVLTGNGDGTFRLASQYAGGYGLFQQPAPVDFNGDGAPDVVALDYTNGQIGLYAGNGDGTLQAAPVFHRKGPEEPKWAANNQVILSADLNGDGAQDVLSYEWVHATVHGPADLYAGINDGSGNLTWRLALPAGKLQELGGKYNGFSIESASADFNGDGRSDVIYRTGPGLAVALAREDGTLTPDPIDVTFPVPVGCLPFSYLTTGDVNGDSRQDIVAGFLQNKNCAPSASTPSGFFVLLGDGQGHFEARFTPHGDSIFFVRLGDWNGDGRPDLALANNITGRGFEVQILQGNGSGDFDAASARTVIPAGHYVSNLLAVDYNDDGRLDLVAPTAGQALPDGTADPSTAGLLLLPSMGAFSFGEPVRVLEGTTSNWNGAGFGDFNGDGRKDLVVSTYGRAQAFSNHFGVVVLPSTGNGTFGPPVSALASLTVTGRNPVLFVTDFNSDGAPDILTATGHAGQLLLNTTSQR